MGNEPPQPTDEKTAVVYDNIRFLLSSWKTWSKYIQYLGVVTLSLIVATFFWIGQNIIEVRQISDRAAFSMSYVDRLIDKTDSFDKRLAALETSITKLLGDGSQVPTEPKVAALAAGQADIEKRLKALEEGLLDSPSKMLSVPLLRQDLESLKRQHAESMTLINQAVDRSYDLSKWLFPALMALVGGLVIAVLLAFQKLNEVARNALPGAGDPSPTVAAIPAAATRVAPPTTNTTDEPDDID